MYTKTWIMAVEFNKWMRWQVTTHVLFFCLFVLSWMLPVILTPAIYANYSR